jgi:hypothetical protein
MFSVLPIEPDRLDVTARAKDDGDAYGKFYHGVTALTSGKNCGYAIVRRIFQNVPAKPQ